METYSTEAVASIFSGVLFGKFDAVHEAIERLAGGPVWTHQLPSVSRALAPLIAREAPTIAAFDYSAISPETYEAERGRLLATCGESITLPTPLLADHKPDPFRDLPEGKAITVITA